MSSIPVAVLSVVEAASTDASLPHLQQVSFRNGKATATDGFILAERDTGNDFANVTLPADLVRRAAGAAKKDGVEFYELSSKGLEAPHIAFRVPACFASGFPETESLWHTVPPSVTVLLDTNKLTRLVKALGVTKNAPVVRLLFFQDQAVEVAPYPANGARGLIAGCLE